jgi:glycosyltransferase involved in cell wall biosynthesis
MSKPSLTVVIPTYNPRLDYLERVLASMRAQTITASEWDLLVVDNNSNPPVAGQIDISWHPRGEVLVEKSQGKMHAICAAFRHTNTDLVMIMDDDTTANPDLIEQALLIASRHTMLGAWSARVELEFEDPAAAPPARLRSLLAERLIEKASWSNDTSHTSSTPWGCGMCIRRAVADAYLAQTADRPDRLQLDPMGDQPGYGGDTDLAYTGCSIGLGMGVFPQLVITHLIPTRRSTVEYLLRNLEAHEYSHTLHHYALYGTAPPHPSLGVRARRWLRWLKGDSLERAIIAAEDRSRASAHRQIATGEDTRPVTHR